MKAVLSILLFFIVLIGSYLAYLGYFSPVFLSESETNAYVMVYKEYRGNYGRAAKIEMEIYDELTNNEKIEINRVFGIFNQDPRMTREENLTSELGVILEEKYYDRIGDLSKKYQVKYYPKAQSVTSQIPFRNMVSVYMGILKLLPDMERYVRKRKLPVAPLLEIYEIKENKIIYSMPIASKK